jgi:hypothetical protein
MLVPFGRPRDEPFLEYYIFLKDGEAIWMSGQRSTNVRWGEPDEETVHQIDRAWPEDSLLWRVPGITRVLRDALTALGQDGSRYRDVTPPVRFTGEFGARLQEA